MKVLVSVSESASSEKSAIVSIIEKALCDAGLKAEIEEEKSLNQDRPAVECKSKHTEYNPSLEEWICPNCGAKEPGDFYIEYPAEAAAEECEKLHPTDILRCIKCKYETTGKKWADSLAKKMNVVKCPCCNGKGMVPRPKPESVS
jgi:DNA-directed RNA polymerase subunit RPC12/RpoP